MVNTRIKTTTTRLQKHVSLTAQTTDIITAARKQDDVQLHHRFDTADTDDIEFQTHSIILNSERRSTNQMLNAKNNGDHMMPINEAAVNRNRPKLLSNLTLSHKSTNMPAALKNRKLYMITEKCNDDDGNIEDDTLRNAKVQKRKMYLILEDNSTNNDDVIASKQSKTEPNNGAFMLSVHSDTSAVAKSDDNLTHKFEKILPEILHRFQAKTRPISSAAITKTITATKNSVCSNDKSNNSSTSNSNQQLHQQNGRNTCKKEDSENTERLPITLPPKKNRLKIDHSHQYNCNGNAHSQNNVKQQTSAATPVIVSVSSLLAANGNSNNYNNHNNPLQRQSPPPVSLLTPQQNINLSTDFLFLMKMLPKLESIPEPHKNYVKHCIEDIITQNAAI